MDTNYPHLVPTDSTVIIANVLPSGAAFAVRLDTGDNCYIPASVALAVNVTLGVEFTAKLVPNRYPDKADRTPWLAVHLDKSSATTTAKVPVPVPVPAPVQYAMPFSQFDLGSASKPELTVTDQVRAVMTAGGVWTLGSLFEGMFPGKTRGGSLKDYNAISAAVRGMYAKGECAKFQLWRSADQTKPSREWFTCRPDRADVDEWEGE